MKSLAQLFGGEVRVRIMRFFLFNPDLHFDEEAIRMRLSTKPAETKNIVKDLTNLGFLKKNKQKEWMLDHRFVYVKELRHLLVEGTLISDEDLIKRVGKTGRIRLIVLAGVFVQNWDSRVDLLVVGDRIKERSIISLMKSLEAEIGKEIRFAALSTEDFKYRISISDRLIRDIVDFPYRKIYGSLDMAFPAIHKQVSNQAVLGV
jgi:hypothetical protein